MAVKGILFDSTQCVGCRACEETCSRKWGVAPVFFRIEAVLFAIPMLFLFQTRIQANPRALYLSAVLAIFGFFANRLNVSLTGMEAGSGVKYIPKWTEAVVTLAIVALGFAVSHLASKYPPIFESAEPEGAALAEFAGLHGVAVRGT